MNLFRAFLLGCVAFSFGGCSADNMSRLDVEGLHTPAAYADSEEFDDVEATRPVVFNTVNGECHLLDPPDNTNWMPDNRMPVFVSSGKPWRMRPEHEPCQPGMRIFAEHHIG